MILSNGFFLAVLLLDDAFNMIIFYSVTSLLWEDGILGVFIYASCFFVYFYTSMLRIGGGTYTYDQFLSLFLVPRVFD